MSRTNPALVAPSGAGTFAKLKALAQKNGKPVDEVAQRFVLEAAIRRIFQSDHADKFGLATSLKGGALMFFSEGVDPVLGRSTSDIDIQLSGFEGTMEELADAMREALAQVPRIDDGVRFDTEKLKVLATRENGIPGGSVLTLVQIGNAVIKLKADVGFYAPEMKETLEQFDYPSLLPNMPPVRIWRQPVEYSVADKVHAACRHAGTNTRLRDYYDLYVYATRCQLDPDRLRQAFAHTWQLFGDTPPANIDDVVSYGHDFVEQNSERWNGMRSGSKWAVPVPDLAEVVETIRSTISPVLCPGSFHPRAA